ncbi:hypothetical protein HWD32_gp53 [Gordonia phage Secretariat]|uniref:Uncharacterized protein n=1 Tax=Gordonia phage Secretariat TaxID=2725616 RepID=A0A6M3SWU4_9CAUD|nr:hypothetical protein HWD32_gp53 [Gordonia phage Secretariat]QJD49630.1 hypothetical protein SEA_SECRETARIAT_53 [Gordonia phage Secretariat]
MENDVFEDIVDKVLETVRDTLVIKGAEYVPEQVKDRFHNFHVSAAFNQQRPTEALWGFLTKHLVSLSDMVKDDSTQHSMEKWDEKINDSIIYLILLKGIVTENECAADSETIKSALVAMSGSVNTESLKAKYESTGDFPSSRTPEEERGDFRDARTSKLMGN